ncbi:hypothetical protein D6D01_08376 [Aureobasidium pullulans]|uniref:Uncharacterized protein n=1 Tax=Aureobasidium pullulans TaxID=5580 RepID=A0A4S9KBS9_AURPU|nr:hypothetical protein D6D01_08376 [Aureobasidium pullulans]
MEDQNETENGAGVAELDKNNEKGQINNAIKTNDVTGMYLPAASIFNILHNAIGDCQETIKLERRYLSGKPKFTDRILIDEEDVKLMEEWSEKYEVTSTKTKHLHKVLTSLERKKVDQGYHQRMVEWIFDALDKLMAGSEEGFNGGEREYKMCIEKLAVLTLELARCDLASEHDGGKKKSA